MVVRNYDFLAEVASISMVLPDHGLSLPRGNDNNSRATVAAGTARRAAAATTARAVGAVSALATDTRVAGRSASATEAEERLPNLRSSGAVERSRRRSCRPLFGKPRGRDRREQSTRKISSRDTGTARTSLA